MKCKLCGYKHGWDNETLKEIKGHEGDFYTSELSRFSDKEDKLNSIYVYGCPACKGIFMADYENF